MSVEKNTSSPDTKEVQLKRTQIDTGAFSKIENATAIYRPILGDIGISPKTLEQFLIESFGKKGLQENHLEEIAFSNGAFLLYGKGFHLLYKVDEINQNNTTDILDGEKIDNIQKRVNNIHLAIESIYRANDGFSIFDGEINDKDIISTNDYGNYCEGKTLSQLKEMLEGENKKLYAVYDITGETQKKQKLLREEIKFFTGVGEKGLYEGGARYFALSTEEIDTKVSEILGTMDNFDDMFTYLRDIHKDIKGNFKKSEMVKQVNGKLIKSLHTIIFHKLKIGNANNIAFLEFAKILTGRGEAKKGKEIGTSYDSIPMYEAFKDHTMANEAITYVMMKEGGVLQEMNKKTEVQDPDIEEGKNPQEILSGIMPTFDKIGKALGKNTEELLKSLKLEHVLKFEGEYNNLSFFDKVDLGALVRIERILKSISTEDIEKNPNILQEKIMSATKESMDELNESLSDNFDGNNLDLSFGKGFLGFLDMNFGGQDANDLGFQGEFAEVFNLYQDMNGNSGFFDWSDEMQDALTPSLATITTVAAGFLIYGAAIAFLAATAPISGPTILATMAVGAVAGATTGVVINTVSDQGYDTYAEGTKDVAASISLNTGAGALFLLGSSLFLSRFMYQGSSGELLRHRFHTVPFFSKLNFAEMGGFGMTEAYVSGTLIGPVISAYIQQQHRENHFDTDETQEK